MMKVPNFKFQMVKRVKGEKREVKWEEKIVNPKS
jgi:hypothetical protein